MRVTIRTLVGENYDVQIGDDSTVRALKEKFHEMQVGFPPESSALIFQGRKLEDDWLLSQHVQDGALLYVIFLAPQTTGTAETISTGAAPSTIAVLPAADAYAYGQPVPAAQYIPVPVQYPIAAYYGPGLLAPGAVDPLERDLMRYSLFNTVCGYCYCVFGFFYCLVGLVRVQWAWILLGAFAMVVGMLAVRTRTQVVSKVRLYLFSLIAFFCAGLLIWTLDFRTNEEYKNDEGQFPSVLSAFISALLICVLTTASCMFLARRHLHYCLARDDVVANQARLAQASDSAYADQGAQAPQSHFQISDDPVLSPSSTHEVAIPMQTTGYARQHDS